VLIRNETILATEPLRFRDEFVRHKILDVLGDITLLGRPVGGAYRGRTTRSRTERRNLQRRSRDCCQLRLPFAPPMPAETPTESALGIMQLLCKILPHRYPFLMVDQILKIEGDERITGLKNVTINEPYFQGHFPRSPDHAGRAAVGSDSASGRRADAQRRRECRQRSRTL